MPAAKTTAAAASTQAAPTHSTAVAEPPATLDASPPQAAIPSVEDSLALAASPTRARIAFNPSAGDVHHRERGAPWRVEVDRKLAAANEKASEEQREKRRWGLAKQVQDGLVHNFGINYGVAELSNILKEGIALKTEPPSRELTPVEVAYVQFLATAEKYDLKQLVVLLEKFPKGREANKCSSKS